MQYSNPHGAVCPWHSWAEKTGAPNIKWCEETLCAWISEPANTWSNLGYLAAGIAIFCLALHRKQRFALKLFGPIVFFMGLMSLIYHMSNIYLTQVLDFVGMFLFVGWAIALNLNRMGKISGDKIMSFVLDLAVGLSALVHIMYLLGVPFQILVLLAAVVIMATEFAAQKQARGTIAYKWFASTLGLLLIALSFSVADGKRLWCDTSAHGWFSQGHALWHWIAALAMFTFYLHYSNLDHA
jgi:hypothetical protein